MFVSCPPTSLLIYVPATAHTTETYGRYVSWLLSQRYDGRSRHTMREFVRSRYPIRGIRSREHGVLRQSPYIRRLSEIVGDRELFPGVSCKGLQ
ncbi:hypothetical protein FA95DRAFT_608769 [Auriscalpium vulgare]|uniref:Uncharacterized protein n=1 Tax=Auriscalpium vulgare TaxID=40419 RepID=A0ACB8RF01_9AGAM|nr:hypothetical protein FA95DRAFT_608769 [Auriscalpium vulgare]